MLSLRPATHPDIPLIAALADRIWRVHYVPIIGQEQVDYMLALMYSPKSLEKQLEDGHLFFIAEKDDLPVGYVSVSRIAAGEYFMHKFYIEIKEQGKGYGKKIMAELFSLFPDLGTMRLQVNRMNYKSINFYFRTGFVIEEAKDFDIGNGFLMEDFVMIYRKP